MAHKLAVLVYRMLRWAQEYLDKGLQYYEDRHRAFERVFAMWGGSYHLAKGTSRFILSTGLWAAR